MAYKVTPAPEGYRKEQQLNRLAEVRRRNHDKWLRKQRAERAQIGKKLP